MTTAPDLLDEGFYADLDGMHETFTRLRATDPVYRDPATGIVGVTRHADVVDVERRAGQQDHGRLRPREHKRHAHSWERRVRQGVPEEPLPPEYREAAQHAPDHPEYRCAQGDVTDRVVEEEIV